MEPTVIIVAVMVAYFTGVGLVMYVIRFRVFSSHGDDLILAWLWPLVVCIGIIIEPFFAVRWGLRQLQWHPIQRLDWWVAWSFKRLVAEDEYGRLYAMPCPYTVSDVYGQRMRVVKVTDCTGTYWLPVPPETELAKEGVAWSYDMRLNEFNPVRV